MNLMWATSVDESAYLLKGEGVFCTITGTVASGAANGAKSDLKVVPTVRDDLPQSGVVNEDIDVGYTKDGEKIKYNVELKNGKVTVGNGGQTTSGSGKYLKGDANCDGAVNIADATAIVQALGNKDKYGLSEQGEINADVDGVEGVTGSDALEIQKLEAGMIDKL
ncbi:MAG: dockerin type I repeat-containing protein [Ruminococcus sp.]|nr:dockerin type I repeat-containing protein [Ruminococcus sp.]